MPDAPALIPDPEAPEPRRPSPQDQHLQAEITAWERPLEAARDDADVQAVIAPAGFDPADLDARLVLVAAAGAAFAARAAAMADEDRAVGRKQTLFRLRRKEYTVFRQIARARFHDDPDARAALLLEGEMPGALDGFVTHARSAYTNAAAPPYTARLAVRGYAPARLATLGTALNELVTAAETADSVEGRAVGATGTRDGAAQAARKSFAEFRDSARPLLAPFPELLRRIGL